MSLKRGYSIKDVFEMVFEGGKKSFVVLQVFFLIGILTSLWISSGTIPAIVYYGIKFMNPNFFIFYTFIIVSMVSMLLGTSFGTTSTIGVAIIVMAKTGNINLNLVTGAIMSGAYLGDRCSPMSSSAILVANLTETNLYDNIKNMFKTGKWALIISSVLYFLFSFKNPIIFSEENIANDIYQVFNISIISLIPAALILTTSLLKVKVKKSMLISIVSAFFLSIIVENYSIMDLLNFSVFGFKLENNLKIGDILNVGGAVSMAKASIVVFISCSLAGIFGRTRMLNKFQDLSLNAQNRFQLFLYTTVSSILTSILGCSQAISIVLTEQFLKDAYIKLKYSKEQLALDLEDTAVLIAPLIPWNIAAYVPTTTLNVNFYSYIPYAFYLYLLPIISLIIFKIKSSSLEPQKKTA
jgi:NhaC family Na+:H+ antiporter